MATSILTTTGGKVEHSRIGLLISLMLTVVIGMFVFITTRPGFYSLNKLISVSIVILFLVHSQSGCSNNGNETMSKMNNLEIVEAIYKGFAAGDMKAILDSMNEDIVWLHPGDSEQIPFAGKFEGKAGVVQFFETAFARIDVLEQKIFSFEASGDKVLVVGYEHMQVKNTGKEYQSNWIHMYTLAGGQVIAFEEFIDTAALVSAFSSDE